MDPSAGERSARQRGRRVVMAAYYAVVVAFIAIAAVNITWQVWAPRFRSYPPVDCRTGLQALAHVSLALALGHPHRAQPHAVRGPLQRQEIR